jgi:hypothetical protein
VLNVSPQAAGRVARQSGLLISRNVPARCKDGDESGLMQGQASLIRPGAVDPVRKRWLIGPKERTVMHA